MEIEGSLIINFTVRVFSEKKKRKNIPDEKTNIIARTLEY